MCRNIEPSLEFDQENREYGHINNTHRARTLWQSGDEFIEWNF